MDARAAAFGPLSQAYRGHLGDRAYGFGEAAPYGLDARDERCRDRAHAGDQNPQLPFRGRDRHVLFIGQVLISFQFRQGT